MENENIKTKENLLQEETCYKCHPINEIRYSTELAGNIFGPDYLKCDGSFVLKVDYPFLLLPVISGQMQLPNIQDAWIRASFPIETIRITESGIWTVPFNVTNADIFAVGGGGGGGGDAYQSDTSGNGGNGGQIVTESITVIPGEEVSITIGIGGIGGDSANNYSTATNGGDTVFGSGIIAQGGLKGYSRQESGGSPVQPSQPGCTTGGNGSIYGTWYGSPGEDGVLCPFFDLDEKFGASGAGGTNVYRGYSDIAIGGKTGGGNGGGGNNNTQANKGSDATFYGSGGGGGGFSSSHSYSQGGNGYQGIVIVRYYRNATV